MFEMDLKRVLSIQSHVVSGYVGNKSSTFPLQVLGYDVDAINSVQLSNHTGYKCFKGQVLKSEDLKVLYSGLKENSIDFYSHLLTGYCGSESFLNEILEVLKELKKTNPNLIYLCDPVMGDSGKFYVPESLLPIYRDHFVPLADIITPNQFEAELLTGVSIKTEADAVKAMRVLHDKGSGIVVLTSSTFEAEENLVLLASKKADKDHYIRLPVKRLDAVFTGTGDLFASMLLAWLNEHQNNLTIAVEKTMSAIQEILANTLSAAQESIYGEPQDKTMIQDFERQSSALAGEGNQPTVAQIELRLVQSLDIIRNPKDLYKAEVKEI